MRFPLPSSALKRSNKAAGCPDKCLKWREIPFSKSFVGKEFPEHWACTDNLDKTCSRYPGLPFLNCHP